MPKAFGSLNEVESGARGKTPVASLRRGGQLSSSRAWPGSAAGDVFSAVVADRDRDPERFDLRHARVVVVAGEAEEDVPPRARRALAVREEREEVELPIAATGGRFFAIERVRGDLRDRAVLGVGEAPVEREADRR